MERLTLTIAGMHCDHCVGRVTKALQQLQGVKVEKVASGTASVSFDPAQATTAAIAQAVTAVGYPAQAA